MHSGTNQTKQETGYPHAAPWRIYATLLFLCIAMLLLVLYMGHIGLDMGTGHQQMIDATMQIQIESQAAHLNIEEFSSGARAIDAKKVWQHLDMAERYVDVMLEGGVIEGDTFLPLEEPAIRKSLSDIQTSLERARSIARQQFASLPSAGARVPINHSQESIFQALEAQTDELMLILRGKVRDDLNTFRIIQYVLMGSIPLLFTLAWLVLRKYEGEKAKAFSTIQSALHQANREKLIRQDREEEIVKLAKFPSENPAPVFRVAENGDLLYLNDASRLLLQRYEIDNETTLPELWNSITSEALRSGSICYLDAEYEEKTVSFDIVPVQEMGYANWYGRDVTKQRLAEANLRQNEALLAESEKLAATGRMAARVAHEINNPLAGIKAAFQVVKKAIPEDYPRYKHVGRIENEIDRIQKIVRQMVDLHRIEQEVASNVRIREVIEDVVSLSEPLCLEHGISVDVDTIKACDMTLVPENGLRQILFGILANSIEASPRGETVNIRAETEDGHLRITIADQGDGVPEENRDRIFEPFFTTKDAQTSGGLGLGLSIAKGIAEAFGGTLHFNSQSAQGTIFIVEIPTGEVNETGQEELPRTNPDRG